ncbi:MAG TPA: hypothetical protein DGB85_06375 [Deltaproteobacteria bacterium]|nr:hypothetical protein [Deltaproteobacteria bacterium]
MLSDLDKINNDTGKISILFEPMELIGGDCYWLNYDKTHTSLGLFDCTGHGVPGAFITTVLLSGLQRLGANPQPSVTSSLAGAIGSIPQRNL